MVTDLKYYCLPFLLLFVTSNVSLAQNLVPNPSFEDTVLCPHSTNQVDRAAGWHPSRNSPDYFNECDWINGTLSVPYNFQGYQYAHSGVAYCGIIAFSHNDPNYREDFTCQLISPLTVGKKYDLSFYASWAGLLRIACNKFGFLLSTSNFDTLINAPLANFCQLYADSILTDSVNWTFIHKSFIADSGYSFLSFGNFFDSSQVDTLRSFPSSIAYYYVDDISVTEDTTTTISELNSEEIKVFPNPFFKKFIIESKLISNSLILIYDINGKLLYKNLLKSNINEIEINGSEIKPGVYLLKILLLNKNPLHYKLIKF